MALAMTETGGIVQIKNSRAVEREGREEKRRKGKIREEERRKERRRVEKRRE